MISRILIALVGIPAVFVLCTIDDRLRLGLIAVATCLGHLEFHRMALRAAADGSGMNAVDGDASIATPPSAAPVGGTGPGTEGGSAPTGVADVPPTVLRSPGMHARLAERNGPTVPLAIGVALLLVAHAFGERGLLLGVGAVPLVLAVREVFRGLGFDGFRRYSRDLAGILYLPACMAFWVLLGRSVPGGIDGGRLVFGLLASVWAVDSGAYAVGMSLRGPRLAPRISPNKTVSGAIGGVLGAVAGIIVFTHLGFVAVSGVRMAVLVVIIGVLSQLADLFESLLKREFATKDSGTLLGGHGGMLDRLDSLVLIAPFCYACCVWPG